MSTEWEILNAFTIPTLSPTTTLIGRITRPKQGSAIMFDLRNFTQERPTKLGMAVHLPELKWLNKTLIDGKEGSLERPHRAISITKLWYGTRFTVKKKKVNLCSDVTLDVQEIEFLKSQLPDVIAFMEQQSILMKIPIEFVAGERVEETYPKD